MRKKSCLMPRADLQVHDGLVMGATGPRDQRPGNHTTTRPEDHRTTGGPGQGTRKPWDQMTTVSTDPNWQITTFAGLGRLQTLKITILVLERLYCCKLQYLLVLERSSAVSYNVC